ncbi:hypothetical protein RRG08_012965 [Elysia crispata]|uniref:Uncharacterized protein n=1 Tax=Elysia crispata TaxID=231223 RepID=A0AAE1A1T6_9GAST|nr:hypothetical protein RRG08_012965 [Elysia crispata]
MPTDREAGRETKIGIQTWGDSYTERPKTTAKHKRVRMEKERSGGRSRRHVFPLYLRLLSETGQISTTLFSPMMQQ